MTAENPCPGACGGVPGRFDCMDCKGTGTASAANEGSKLTPREAVVVFLRHAPTWRLHVMESEFGLDTSDEPDGVTMMRFIRTSGQRERFVAFMEKHRDRR